MNLNLKKRNKILSKAAYINPSLDLTIVEASCTEFALLWGFPRKPYASSILSTLFCATGVHCLELVYSLHRFRDFSSLTFL